MSSRSQPRNDGPGIVRVRLMGEEFDAGFIASILRDHPEVELVGTPSLYPGGRVYATVRVRRDRSLLARPPKLAPDRAGDKSDPEVNT
jgi:hypothetical protein